MFSFKTPYLFLMLGLVVPVCSYANLCIAVGGGFGKGGTSFIGQGFAVPGAGACKPWAGFTKTASTVIANATGSGCLSSDKKVLTLIIFNSDPPFFGAGNVATDAIQLCPTGVTGCPVNGQDTGSFSGTAAEQTCTSTLLQLPSKHD